MSDEYQRLKQRALSLLSRREHAVSELRQKLSRHQDEPGMIDDLLNELMERNYLNEERYVEMMIRSRYGRGHGPMRIKQELRLHRVSDGLISQCFEDFDADWFELAKSVRDKKFGAWEAGDYTERAKQMRFLASRGFSTDQIDEAFS